tara:strand:- start:588 stop:1715 length:1128 start_codon:yes stop_codon:yes gene_type:complete
MLGLGNTITSTSHHEQQYSLLLDGTDDHLDIGDHLDVGTDNFSISLWFKADTYESENDYIFSKYQGQNDRIDIFLSSTARINALAVGGGDTIFHCMGGSISGLGSVWVHVLVSCDRAGNTVLYVNGVTTTYGDTETTDTSTSQTLSNTASIKIGALSSSGGSNFLGKVDDVAIFNVAIDSDAALAIYNSGKPFNLNYDRGDYVNSSALTGYWRMFNGLFDDKQNGVVHDAHDPGFGSDLVVNGSFDADSGWTKQDGWTISGGTANFDFNNDNGSNRNIYPASSILTAGNTYKLEFDITSVTAGGIRMVNSSVSDDTTFSTVGTHVLYWKATGVHLYMKADDDAILSIDNVRVSKLNGYPGITSADATFSTDTPDD